MAVSVRMDPLMEKELELAAKRKGVTKSQFIIDAVQHALGHQDPYALLLKIEAEEQASPRYQVMEKAFANDRFQGDLGDSDAVRTYIRDKLKKKHGLDAG
ncbi:hypothetical protein [Pseudorhodoferax sp. Leaf267]|uniref:hypothetical protein n=1 Tax=Pseudorhodoferax sp. Leaf267 TaxID=1736316 RepID=UPI0012E1F34C|nr:hypothetical protein [Pseudorhodoferax sp. Leaf267]